MPLYDFKCPHCAQVRQDVIVPSWNDAVRTHMERCTCGAEMLKQLAAPAFVVNGYNAKNGYTGTGR